MCGINGIFAYHRAAVPVDRGELERSRDRMAPRGPDGAGAWYAADGRVALAHRRLAIIDLSEAGAQPMASADGTVIVTFSGEIYNYRELRHALAARGWVFRSRSDTEVLLYLYAEKGEAMVHDLRGMFAFAIWDARRGRLLLARDPYGIKPLYYADDGRTLRFASQVKALTAGGGLSGEPDPAGWAGFLLFGSVPEPFTTRRAIGALPAGMILSADRNGPRLSRYHSIANVYREAEAWPSGTRRERQEALRAALLDSVRHHIVADVPVGAFLSAGIDSGALVGLMRDAGQQPIETVTLAFEAFAGGPDDEAPVAAEAARTYGTRHAARLVTRREFETDLPLILDSMDQPSIDGINTWFVAKAARERGLKVAVSGLGGDELFGGYPSFRDIPRLCRWLAWPAAIPHLGSGLRRAADAARLGIGAKAMSLFEYGGDVAGAWLLRRGLFMPWELERVLELGFARDGLRRLDVHRAIAAVLEPRPGSDFATVATLESSLYLRNQLLRDADWAGMAHSLEIRTPLVDATLLRQVAGLGFPASKQELAAAPSTALPLAVTARRKTGFAVPLAAWMSGGRGAQGAAPYGYARNWALEVAGNAGCDSLMAARNAHRQFAPAG